LPLPGWIGCRGKQWTPEVLAGNIRVKRQIERTTGPATVPAWLHAADANRAMTARSRGRNPARIQGMRPSITMPALDQFDVTGLLQSHGALSGSPNAITRG